MGLSALAYGHGRFGSKSNLDARNAMSASTQIVLQNSQNALRPICRNQTKQAEIADRYSLQAVTEVAREFIAI
jgi:hypothetical protein